jgi:hypothetical protein
LTEKLGTKIIILKCELIAENGQCKVLYKTFIKNSWVLCMERNNSIVLLLMNVRTLWNGDTNTGWLMFDLSFTFKDVGHDNWDFSENFFDCPIL